jgi:N-alpha-acetyltransferase 35, NatC auxiliary subunit
VEWENVQIDAEEIDQLLQIQLEERPLSYGASAASEPVYSLPLSSWAYLYKLRLMEWIVQLGFELQIYQPDELAGMYWYLSYLAKRRASHVERIKAFTVRALNDARARQQPLAASREAAFTRSLGYLRTTMLDAAVTWELADALSCLYAVLLRLGLIAAPPRPYSTDELRYEIRMRPFASVGLPELPPFAAFAEATLQPGSAAPAILEYAERAVAGAKKGFEVMSRFTEREAFTAAPQVHERWVAGTKSCLKSAIAVGIAVSTLQRAIERAGGEEANVVLKAEIGEPKDGYHEWWIVPKITTAK